VMLYFPRAAVFALQRYDALIRSQIKNRCHSFILPSCLSLNLLQNKSGDNQISI
jgi:hypothetical protein